MKKNILLVDDDEDIIEFLQYNLEKEGFKVITACSGQEALSKINNQIDLILLDIMMPNMDGFEVLSKIRQNDFLKDIPVIFLTAKSGEKDEITGLNLGANDFIAKPISPQKLIARVKSNIRKISYGNSKASASREIVAGPIKIDKDKHLVQIKGKNISLPRKEFSLLYFFVTHPNKVFDRDTLLKEIWGSDVYVTERTVDVHIRKVREKLGKYSQMIKTLKGVGYKFLFDE